MRPNTRAKRSGRMTRRIPPGPLARAAGFFHARCLESGTAAMAGRETNTTRDAPTRVACLGPAGTFSELAARELLGRDVPALLLPTLDEVFRAVESGAAELAVVPVENSTEGGVGRTLDLLAQSPTQV